ARSDYGQAIERTGNHVAVDDLLAALAVPAGNLQRRIVEDPRKAETMPRPLVSPCDEVDESYLAELAGDGLDRLDASDHSQRLGRNHRAGRKISGAFELAPRAVDFDHQAGARTFGLTPAQDV